MEPKFGIILTCYPYLTWKDQNNNSQVPGIQQYMQVFILFLIIQF